MGEREREREREREEGGRVEGELMRVQCRSEHAFVLTPSPHNRFVALLAALLIAHARGGGGGGDPFASMFEQFGFRGFGNQQR